MIVRLVTDPQALWAAWVAERRAYMAHPTPAGLDRCLEAFKPYYLRLCGRDGLEEAMAREVAACNAVLIAARVREGGRNG